MESLFEINEILDSSWYSEFGTMYKYSCRKRSPLRILGLIFLLFAPVCLFFQQEMLGYALYIAGAVWYLVGWVLVGKSIGSSSYRAANPAACNRPVLYRFGESGFEAYTAVDASSLQYISIMSIAESDQSFFLQTSRNAGFILWKGAFTKGSPEAFRDFLQAKTGKPVQRCKVRRSAAVWILPCIAVFLWLFVSMVAVRSVQNLTERAPQSVSRGNFSMELPGNFEKESDGSYLAYAGPDAYVWVDRKPLEGSSIDAPLLAQRYFEALPADSGAELYTLPDGTVCTTYTGTVDGTVYCYCDAFYVGADYGWIVQFLCEASDWETLWPDFQTWAQTVEISD